MQFPRDYYDYKLECSNGTIETHAYLLKCLSDYFVADGKFGAEEKQIVKVSCDMVVMQSILDLVYYGWRTGATISADVCGEILATCDYLQIRKNIIESISEKLINPDMYKPEDINEAHKTIITMRPEILQSAVFLNYAESYSLEIVEVILGMAEVETESKSWVIVAKLTELVNADTLFELFKKHKILFNILVWYYSRGNSTAIVIIKKLSDENDIMYVYDTLIEFLKYGKAKRDQDLFQALAEKIKSGTSQYRICIMLSKY